MAQSRSLDDEVLCLDLQTSGARPPVAQIIEAGYCLCQAGTATPDVTTRLVQFSGNEPLPRQISRVTGLTVDQLQGEGISLAQLWDELSSLIKGRSLPLVIHYAGFETPFLQELSDAQSDLLDIFCTFEMARRLIPEIPSRSLRALSGYLGHPIDKARRSLDHVAATFHIWRQLCAMAKEQYGITDFDGLRRLLAESAPQRGQKKSYVLTPEARLALPAVPGIYRFRDARGRILYIGKAQNLKSRVNSYFRGQRSKGSRLNELTSQIAGVDVDQAFNPLHACLMENDKIKEHQPPYNRALLYGERAIGFMNSDLLPCDAHDPAVAYGPFSALSYVVHLAEWMALINDPARPLPERSGLAALDATLIAGGIRLFCQKYALSSALQKEGWRSLLIKLWAEDLKERRAIALETWLNAQKDEASLEEPMLDGEEMKADEKNLSEDEEGVVDLSAWNEERFCAHIERVFCGLARRIHRGRTLRTLANGRLVFRYGEGLWHILDMAGGIASFTAPTPLFEFGNNAVPHPHEGLTRFAFIDVLVYDRLAILCAELRRMLVACSEVIWCRPSGAPWHKSEMYKLFFSYP